MIHSIYNLVGRANLEQCSKDRPIINAPLFKINYLSEFLTLLEKSEARKNLGILITGEYYYLKNSTTDIKLITNVNNALDFLISIAKSYLDKNIEKSVLDLITDYNSLNTIINDSESGINAINSKILEINTSITKLNNDLLNLDITTKISEWINTHQGAVRLDEDGKLGFAISKEEGNAIKSKEDGLYVESPSAAVYHTELSDNTEVKLDVGGITKGTTVALLKNKEFSTIINMLLFPSTTRDLIYPTISSIDNLLVEVGTTINLQVSIDKGDAGEITNLTITTTYKGLTYTSSTYTNIGTYVHNINVSYSAGNFLVDSKGELSNKRVEAGTLSKEVTVDVTYPWYYDNSKGELVKYNTQSEVIDILLKSVIKLPGINSTLDSFKVDGGIGYMNVNLDGWSKTTEKINNYTYSVWTKNEPYSKSMPHKILFTLK